MFRKGDFRKLLAISFRKRGLLMECALWLVLARLAVLTMPFRRAAFLFGLRATIVQSSEASASTLAAEIGWAVQVASARMLWKCTCLTQALAGAAMLGRRHIPATLFLGIAKDDAPAELSAHAWLISGGYVLTGDAVRERYKPIAMFHARGG